MVYTPTVLTTPTCIERLVVNKAFEYGVNCLTHNGFPALQSTSFFTPRIVRVVVYKTIEAVFVVFAICIGELTLYT